ncbi:MAG: hypothetical protein WB646_14055 [Steroidobacteraceae bacterium]
MLDDLHIFASKDPSHVSLQGRQNRFTVIVRIDSLAIDDLPGVGFKPTIEQRTTFARHNLDAIREIAENLLERGEAHHEDRLGQPGLAVRIRDIDFAEYLLKPRSHLSLAAFDLRAQSKWASGWQGRFA